MKIVYFSGASGFTHRFVERLGAPAVRLPLHKNEPIPIMDEPYLLIVPTYGIGTPQTAVPPPVKKFIQEEQNAKNCLAVIGSGNTNFGGNYCLGAFLVARRLKVPVIYKFELLGTEEDQQAVSRILTKLRQGEQIRS